MLCKFYKLAATGRDDIAIITIESAVRSSLRTQIYGKRGMSIDGSVLQSKAFFRTCVTTKMAWSQFIVVVWSQPVNLLSFDSFLVVWCKFWCQKFRNKLLKWKIRVYVPISKFMPFNSLKVLNWNLNNHIGLSVPDNFFVNMIFLLNTENFVFEHWRLAPLFPFFFNLNE